MKKFIFLFSLLLPAFVFGQSALIKKLYADTLHTDALIKEQIVFKIKVHEADTNTLTSLHFTSIIAYKVNEAWHLKTNAVKEHETKSIADRVHNKLSPFVSAQGTPLSAEQVKTLMSIYSSEDNFLWSSCLDKTPQAGFVFLNNGKIIGCINISCNFTQTDPAPYLLQTKWGMLTKDAAAKLIELGKELGIYYGIKK